MKKNKHDITFEDLNQLSPDFRPDSFYEGQVEDLSESYELGLPVLTFEQLDEEDRQYFLNVVPISDLKRVLEETSANSNKYQLDVDQIYRAVLRIQKG